MREGWQLKTLGEICSFENGDRGENYPSKSVQTTSGIPFINAGHLTDFGIDHGAMNYIPKERFDLLGNGKIRKGDILFCLRGSLGKFASVGELSEGAIASSLVIVRPKESVLNKYVLAYFQSNLCSGMINKFKNGAAQPNLSAGSLKKFIIPIPLFPEQQRIVAILDEAFAGIATAVANTEKNLANARELFESYLNNVFTQKGEGWVEKTIGEIADHSLGKMLDKAKNKGSLKPYLRNINVRWFEFDLNDMLEMRFEDDESQTYTAKKGDVLICEGGYPGRSAIWENDEPVYFQKALHRVRFKNIEHNKWFLYFIYLADAKNDLRKYFTGTGIQHFTGKALHRFRIPIPPTPVIRKSVERFDALFEETNRLESIYQHKLTTLAELKQSILHKAFSGALTSQSVSALQEAVA